MGVDACLSTVQLGCWLKIKEIGVLFDGVLQNGHNT